MKIIRTTIKDIAGKLGVSVKTVSNALNGRGEVGDGLRQLIIDTAGSMNYVPNKNAKALSRVELNIVAVTPLMPAEFYAFVGEGLLAAGRTLEDLRCTVTYRWYSSPNAHAEVKDILGSIIDGNGKRPDGIVLTCSYDSGSYIGELNHIREMNIPVFFNTLSSGLGFVPDGSVALDTKLAGRMAAEYLAAVIHSEPPDRKVAIMTGNASAPIHSGCIVGFTEEAKAGKLDIVECLNTFEDKNTAAELTREILARNPDIRGIYVTSYNSVGVCDGLGESGMTGKVAVIGHDLYPEITKRLKSGALNASLFQNQYEYGRECLTYLYERIIGERTAERCVKIHAPQLIMRCMADNYPHYGHIPKLGR